MTLLRPLARHQLGLVPRIIILAVVGVLTLGVAVTTISTYLLRNAAEDAARERVDTNMKVAWQTLRAKGEHFRVEDGRLLAGDHVLSAER